MEKQKFKEITNTFFEVFKENAEENKDCMILMSGNDEETFAGIFGSPRELIPTICQAMKDDDDFRNIIIKSVKTFLQYEILKDAFKLFDHHENKKVEKESDNNENTKEE